MTQEVDSIIPKSLTDAVKDTFSIQAGTPVEIVKVYMAEPQSLKDISIISAIGLKSSKYSGILALCFPSKPFLGILSKMLGESYSEITTENSDAAGEWMNIVYASARVKINQAGNDFSPALPTVTRGSNVQISHGSTVKIIRVDCQCEFGIFHMELSLKVG